MSNYLRTRQILAAALLAVGTLTARSVRTQDAPPVLLLLDSNAIAAEQAPNLFSPADVNAPIAGIGVRDPIRFFLRHATETVVLPVGQTGHEGWFSLGSMPAAWKSNPSLDDARQNFLMAGPGLGSPDADGNRTSLLTGVAGLKPLGVPDLQLLAGQNACVVVFSNELPWSSTGTSLEGPTNGVMAFSVLSVATGDDGTSTVSMRILDFAKTCAGALSLRSF